VIIIKPDAFDRGLVGEILTAYSAKRNVFNRMYSDWMSLLDCRNHYSAHVGKDYYGALVHQMISGLCLFVDLHMDWFVARSIALEVRETWGVEGPRNLIHASDSAEADVAETAYWFEGKKK
jgi:nucleoside-diphosphate kinase